MKRFFSKTSKIVFVMMCQQDVPRDSGDACAPSNDSHAPSGAPCDDALCRDDEVMPMTTDRWGEVCYF